MATATGARRTVAPVQLSQLMAAIGPTRAADRLGVSTTLIHKARKIGEVNSVVETAAGHVLEHLSDPAPQRLTTRIRLPAKPTTQPVRPVGELLLLSVPAEKLEIVMTVVQALGAQALH